MREYGSPPQVRGKRGGRARKNRIPGITPAGAGKTDSAKRVPKRAQDHPRRCGENKNFLDSMCANIGSPPQVRGKLSSFFVLSILDRITPAGAGKTRFE